MKIENWKIENWGQEKIGKLKLEIVEIENWEIGVRNWGQPPHKFRKIAVFFGIKN